MPSRGSSQSPFFANLPATIVVHPGLPVSNLGELVAYARKNKDRMNYGSAGAGTVSNLAGELFKRVADLPELVHVPYKGGGPLFGDAIAGQIPMSTPTPFPRSTNCTVRVSSG